MKAVVHVAIVGELKAHGMRTASRANSNSSYFISGLSRVPDKGGRVGSGISGDSDSLDFRRLFAKRWSLSGDRLPSYFCRR